MPSDDLSGDRRPVSRDLLLHGRRRHPQQSVPGDLLRRQRQRPTVVGALARARESTGSGGVAAVANGIREALEAGRSIVIHGDAGIGKTHVLSRALSEPGSADLRVLQVTPQLLAAARSPQTPGQLSRLSPQTVELEDRAVDSLARWARERGRGTPVLLRVEDAQRLDDGAARILERLVLAADLPLAATTRADRTLAPSFSGLPHAHLERVVVPPLDPEEVEAILAGRLGGLITADTVHRLWAASRGNPFHLAELVRDQRERGALVCERGIWIWTGKPAVGRRLLDVALNDLAGLGPSEREALEVTAVTGRVPVPELLRVAGRPGVDRLVRLGLVRPAGTSGGLEVAHPLYADAICSQVGLRRRRQMLERAQGWHLRPEDLGEHVVRSVASGVAARVEMSIQTLLRASADALEADDPAAAVRITSGSWDEATSDLDRVSILMARADAHVQLLHSAPALADLAEARTALESLEPRTDQTLVAYLAASRLEAMILHLVRGDLQGSLSTLERAEGWLGATQSGPSGRRALVAVRALRLAHLGWGGRHAEMRDDAVAMLRHAAHPEDVIALVGPTMVALTLAGRAGDADRLHRLYEPIVAGQANRHRWEPSVLYFARFIGLLLTGDHDAAERARPVVGALVDQISVHQRRGLLCAVRGQWGPARLELRAASTRLRRRDSLGMLAHALSWEAYAAAAAGEATDARELLDELDDAPRRCSAVTGAEIDLRVVDTLMWLRDPRALDHALALAIRAVDDQAPTLELEALHRIVVIAGPETAAAMIGDSLAERVTGLAGLVPGARATALVGHIRALASPEPGRIEACESALRAVGVWLPTAARSSTLTRREREIAALAAGGMTSRAIAQRLTLSVRTVDSHLSSAFAKLGVRSREDLEPVLARTSVHSVI